MNLFLVRRHELVEGVAVTTEAGETLGQSVVAAKQGLAECAATRVLWTFLLLTATPLCASAAFAALPARIAFGSGSAARTAIELGVSFVVIWLSVPLAIATFPQRESIRIVDLEPKLQERWHEVRVKTKPPALGAAECAYYNRGL